MPEELKRLKLSPHAAVAIQGAVHEHAQLLSALRQKDAEIKRLTDLQIGEAGVDPEQFRCKGVELLKGETFLTLERIPPPAIEPTGV